MPSTAKSAIDELTLGAGARLEELIDRQSIEALAKSFADLLGVGVRLFDQDGKLLADASLPVELTAYLGTLKRARAGLEGVEVTAIDIPTRFAGFEDYWQPFLGGQGPAPAYAMSLDETARARLRDRIRERIPAEADGSISLTARVWATRTTVAK